MATPWTRMPVHHTNRPSAASIPPPPPHAWHASPRAQGEVPRSRKRAFTVASATDAASASRRHSHSANGNGSEPLGDLRAEVELLRESVLAQSRLLEQQQETINLLKGYMKTRATQSPLLASLGAEDVDSLRRLGSAAINDRRLVGLFDARYHSTSR